MSILHEPLTVRRNKLEDEFFRDRKTIVSIHNSTVYKDVVCVIDGLETERDIAYHMEMYRRICACVNACQGITTEALEAGIVNMSLHDWAISCTNYGKSPDNVMGLKVLEENNGK